MGVEPIIFWLWASYLNRFTHPQVGVAGFEPTTSWTQITPSTKLTYTPKWNGFVLLLPSASTFIEGISRDLAPVYYPPYGHSSSFCGTLLQGLSTTYVSHLPFLILYKYYNKIFIKNQLNNFAIFLLVATPNLLRTTLSLPPLWEDSHNTSNRGKHYVDIVI